MDVTWKKGFDQPAVLERLFKLSHQHQVHPFDADSLVAFTVLRSMIEFPKDFSWETRLDLVAKGGEAAIKAKAKEPDAFIRHVRDAASSP